MSLLNLHAVLLRSRANGPGLRAVVWFQGCRLRCPGCFNPDAIPFEPRITISVEGLLAQPVFGADELDGITISGGEPFDQPAGLLDLAQGIRRRTRLSTILFSGYTEEEIETLPSGPDILRHVDVLIAGRYVESRRLARGLRGSDNKTIRLLTGRYTLTDIQATPDSEVIISPTGDISLTGISPPCFRK
jgi:anaerobic ribonucleoside-triphosphate reductase activating protein